MKNQVIILTVVALFALAGLFLTSQSSGYVTFESRAFENFLYNVNSIPLFVLSTNFSTTELEYSELLQEIVYKRMSSDLRPKTIFRVPIDLPTAKLDIGETIGSVMSSLTEQKILHFGKPQRTFVPRGALNREGVLLDTEAYEYTKYDKIVVGHPCKNSFMREYLYDLSNCSLAFVNIANCASHRTLGAVGYLDNCVELYNTSHAVINTNKFIRTFNEDGKRTLILAAKTDDDFRRLVLEII